MCLHFLRGEKVGGNNQKVSYKRKRDSGVSISHQNHMENRDWCPWNSKSSPCWWVPHPGTYTLRMTRLEAALTWAVSSSCLSPWTSQMLLPVTVQGQLEMAYSTDLETQQPCGTSEEWQDVSSYS